MHTRNQCTIIVYQISIYSKLDHHRPNFFSRIVPGTCYIKIGEEKIYNPTSELHPTQGGTQRYYSSAMSNQLMIFAWPQRAHSDQMACTSTTTDILPERNTHALRWSHSCQDTGMIKESKPFWCSLITLFLQWSHHSTNQSSGPGTRFCLPHLRKTLNQTSLLNTQPMSRRSKVSACWEHKAHGPLFLRPWH
jgi:hypothetical protein